MNGKNRGLRLSAAAVAMLWVTQAVGSPAIAATDPNVAIVNTETVQVYFNAEGKIDAQRVYEQLDMTGHGKVDLRNPVTTTGLRNLDGFGGLDVKGGDQIVKTTVDGSRRLRSVSNYKGDLPVSVAISYKLDGKSVKPGDVVGKSGRLEVTFQAENKTSAPQSVSFPDGKGGTVTKTVDVPVPMVGSITTTTPSNFTNVESGDANVAGNGEGGTQLSFTMTLVPPIGAASATFSYSADITDGVVPEVDISVVPVNPLTSPSFKGAAGSYQSGANTGAELAAGAQQIDTNLLKLRDGAGDLLAGLIQLRNGADQLNSGLGSAVSGSAQLADGAGSAYDGSKKLSAGTKKLDAGLGQAKAGSKKLKAGASDLAEGQKSLTGGLKQLRTGVSSLPQTVQDQLAKNSDYNALMGALTSLIAGVGDTGTAGTLLGGLQAMADGLGDATGGLDQISTKLTAALAAGGSVDQVKAAINAIATNANLSALCTGACAAVLTQVAGGTASAVGQQLTTSLGDLKDGVDQINGGIKAGVTSPTTGGIAKLKFALSNGSPASCDRAKSTSTPLDDCGVKQALQIIKAGIPTLVDGITESVSTTLLGSLGTGGSGCDPTKTLLCAAGALTSGANQVANGAGDLSSGVGDLAAGGSQLSAGAGDLTDGLIRLKNGASELATGLTSAKDGSGKVADGLGQAAGSAPRLVDGSEKLSTEGTKKLVAAGTSTAQSYGEMVAVIDAGATRAKTDAMVNGAPEGAVGLTAYKYIIAGADGEGGRNLARSIGAVVLLGAGGAILALRRRRAALN